MKQNRYVVCRSCHAMNPSFEASCDQCGTPLIAAADVESSTQMEPVIRRTYFQTPTTVRLIGIWAIALPIVLVGIYLPFLLLRRFGGLAGFIFFWGDVGLTCLWFFILYWVTKHYFFRDQKP
jgi:ABC-type tungstate transport system substrate-binding protein